MRTGKKKVVRQGRRGDAARIAAPVQAADLPTPARGVQTRARIYARMPVLAAPVLAAPASASRLLASTILAGLSLSGTFAPTAYANPVDGVVVAGSASISASGAKLDVVQASDRAVIDWRGFDIGAGEHTQFTQPSSSSIALNRVNSNAPSKIDGRLSANGQVVVVNQSGILLGKTAQVDVSGLIATTADIDNDKFMAGGTLAFDKPGKANAAIVNEGSITAREAGLVGLVAPNVVNSGVITAKLGKVHLASGDTATVDLYGDKLLEVAVSDQVTSQLIANTGVIQADGGSIAITAAAGAQVVNSLVSVSGTLQAQSVAEKNGKIEIIAYGSNAVKDNTAQAKGIKTGSSTVLVAATLDASGRKAGERGGSITVTGDNIGILNGSTLDASGESGGGTINIGGDYQGKGITASAKRTLVEQNTRITANALSAGNGGRVILWSDGNTQFSGAIEAKGGAASGDGGFVEVSGKNMLGFSGNVDTSAAHGVSGTLLLDPTDITISNAADTGTMSFAGGTFSDTTASSSNLNVTTLQNQLANNNVLVTTASGLGGTGNLTVSNAVTWSSAHSLTLFADNDLTVSADLTYTGSSNQALTLQANNSILLNAGAKAQATGSGKLDITLNSDRDASGAGAISLGSGTVLTSNGGNITLGGGANPATTMAFGTSSKIHGVDLGSVNMNAAGGNIIVNGTGYTGGTNISNAYGIRFDSNPPIIQTSGNGSISLTGTGGGSGTGSGNAGIQLFGGANKIISAAGAITISGTGGVGGVGLSLGGGTIQSTSGAISLEGKGTTSGSIGLSFSTAATFTSTSGNISISGYSPDYKGFNTNSGAQLALVGDANYSGNITLIGNNVLDGSFQTTGDIIIKPYAAGLGMSVGTSVASTFNVSNTQLGYFTYGGTLYLGGKDVATATAGALTVNTSNVFAKKVAFANASGYDITQSGALSTSYVGAGNAISYYAGRDLFINNALTDAAAAGSGASNFFLSAYRAVRTGTTGNISVTNTTGNLLNLTVDADADANQDGYIYLNSDINTNGGNVVLGGGTNPLTTAAYGNATTIEGVYLVKTLNAAGGNITINGAGYTGGVNTSAARGITFGGTTTTVQTSGNGTITLNGTGGGSGTGGSYNEGIHLWGGGNILSQAGAITLYGVGGVGGGYGIDLGQNLIQSTTGAISLTGVGTSRGIIYNQASTITSSSGGITLDGGTTGIATNSNTPIVDIGGSGYSGDITLISDSRLPTGSIVTTGDIILKPYTAGYGMSIGNNVASTLNIGNAYFPYLTYGGTLYLGGKTVAGATAGALTVNTNNVFSKKVAFVNASGYDITQSGALSTSYAGAGNAITFLSGRDLFINAAITDSAATGLGASNIWLSAYRNIIANNSGSLSVTNAAASGGITNTASLTLNADADADQNGYISLTSGTFSTNGGNITLGGGTTLGSAYAYGNPANKHGITLSNATLNAGGGSISLYGSAATGGTGVASTYGVWLGGSSSLLTTGSGAITVVGRTAADNYTKGIYTDSLTSIIRTENGNITLTGNDQSTGIPSTNYHYGMQLGSTISATGTGAINIYGETSTIDGALLFSDADISTTSGNITLTGKNINTGYNAADYINAIGFYGSTGTSIITTTGHITLNADNVSQDSDIRIETASNRLGGVGMSGNITINANSMKTVNPFIIQTTGNVLINPYSTSGTTGINGSSGGLQITSAILNAITAANVTIGRADGSGLMRIAGAYLSGRNYNLNFQNGSGGIQFDGGGTALTLASNKNLTATTISGNITSGGNGGIVTSGTGYITLTSGNDINFSNDFDLTTATGDVTLRANNSILYSSGGDITTNGGAITLNSDRDASGAGAISLGSGTVLASNGGNITLGGGATPASVAAYGTAANNSGVSFDYASVNAGGGNISVSGHGFNGTNNNTGITIVNSTLQTTGSGTVTLTGIGDGSGNGNAGISNFLGGLVTTVDGALTVNGYASTAPGSGSYGEGVYIYGAFKTTGSGSITLQGIGASGSGGDNTGIGVYSLNGIQTTGTGNITITGTAGNGAYSEALKVNAGSISSAGGNIGITGTVGDFSVYLLNGGSVSALGSGAITVQGTGNAAAGTGLYLNNGIISTVNGALSVTGYAGNGSGGYNRGIIIGAGQLLTTGSGLLTVNGYGSGTGGNNPGVEVDVANGIQTTGSGSIIINGTPGAGASSYGLYASTANAVHTTGTGSVTVNADSIYANTSNALNSANNLTVAAYTQSATTGVAGGSGTLQLTNALLGYLTWGNLLTIGRSDGTGLMQVGNYNWANNVSFLNGSGGIQFTGGTSTLVANKNLTATTASGNITSGADGSIVTSGTGYITLASGNDINFANDFDLTTASGNVTLRVNNSILYSGGGDITTNGGNITLNSDRDASGAGAISLGSGTLLTSNGGAITLGGGSGAITAGNGYAVGTSANKYGIELAGATLSSGAGAVILNGRGYDDAAGSSLHGIFTNYGDINTTSGAISINGIGGNGKHDNVGAYFYNSNFATTSGAITITGTGGTASDVDSSYNSNHGIVVQGTNITSSGSGVAGAITLSGTGAAANQYNFGVQLISFSTISSADANIILNGTGRGQHINNVGIMATGVVVKSTGAGDITLTGASNAASNSYNSGVQIGNSSTEIFTTNGNLNITGTSVSNSGTYNNGVQLLNNPSVYTKGTGNLTLTGIGSAGAAGILSQASSGTNTIGGVSDNGNITLIADTVDITDTTFRTLKDVIFRPYTASATTGVNGATGSLQITSAILNAITAANVTIGRSDGSGLMRIAGADLSSNGYNLNFLNGAGNIQFDGGVTPLTLAANKYLTATTASGDITSSADGAIVTSGTGTITLSSGDDINFANDFDLTTASGVVTLRANNSILYSGSGDITTNGGAIALNSDRDGNGVGRISIGADLSGWDSFFTSNGGNITLGGGSGTISAGSGFATGIAGAPSGSAIGIELWRAGFDAGGGNIVMNGQGAVAAYNGQGIFISSPYNPIVTSGTGTITLTGVGANMPAGCCDVNGTGIVIADYTTIQSENGAITLNGTAGNAVSAGIWVNNVVSTGSSSILINSGSGGTILGYYPTIGGASATGDITFIGDKLGFAYVDPSYIQTTGNINFKTFSQSATTGVAGGAGTLQLTNTLLGYLTWGNLLTIGRSDGTGLMQVGNYNWANDISFINGSGGIEFLGGASTLTTGKSFSAVTSSGGNITNSAPGSVTTNNADITVTANGGGSITFTSFDLIAGGTGQVNMAGQDVTISASNIAALNSDITITALRDILSGGNYLLQTSGTGNILLTAGRDINITHDLDLEATGSGNITLRANNSILYSGGGDIITNGGAITLNSDRDDSGAGAISLGSGTGLTSNGGNIILGGGANPLTTAAYGTASSIEGVHLDTATLSAGGGNISVIGAGYTGGANTANAYGISAVATTIQSTGNGTVSLTGTGGGSGSGTLDYGLLLNTGTQIDTTSGNLSLTGFGSNTATAGQNHYGIAIFGSALSSVNGNIIVAGTGGSSLGGTGGEGIFIVNSATIKSTGSGNITLTGTAGNYSDGIQAYNNVNIYTTTGSIDVTGIALAGQSSRGFYFPGYGNTYIGNVSTSGHIIVKGDSILDWQNTFIRTTGNVSLNPYTASATIGINGSAGDLQITSALLNAITAANVTIGRADGSGLMRVAGADLSSNGYNLNFMNGAGGIQFDGGGTALTLAANKYLTATTASGDITSGGNGGIVTSGTGYITLASGNDLSFANDFDLTTASGDVTLQANSSILYSGGGDITTNGGAITLNADSDASGAGAISLGNGTALTSNGGNITLGGGANPLTTAAYGTVANIAGISLEGAAINAAGGNISLRGIGYTGGTNTSNAYGIGTNYLGTMIGTTGSGTVCLIGTGGGSGSGNYNSGLGLEYSQISTTNGDLTLIGYGSNTAAAGYGHLGAALSVVTLSTVDGNIEVTGTAAATDNVGRGIQVNNHSLVKATGAGNVTLTGTGGNGFYSAGIDIYNDVNIYSNTGNTSLIGISTPGDYRGGFVFQIYGGVSTIGHSSMSGNILLQADAFQPNGWNNAAIQTTGSVTFAPRTDSTSIGLSGASGDLQLSSALLDSITASNITIGRADGTGAITANGYSWDKDVSFVTGTGGIALDGVQAMGAHRFVARTTGASDIMIGASGGVSSSAPGNAIVLASARNFINNGGAGAVTVTGGGRWLAYSKNASGSTAGGLLSDFRRFSSSYSGYAPGMVSESGNGFLYADASLGTISITADNTSRQYGDVNPAFSYSFNCTTGCTEAASLTGAPLLTTSATQGSNVGTYTITADIGSLTLTGAYADYLLSLSDGTLTVDPRQLTVTADNGQGKIYGASDPALTYQITSGSLYGADSFTGALSRAAGSNAGIYAISQGTLSGGSNYAITFTPGKTFSITPRALTIAADSKSKAYGASDPNFTYAITSGSLVGGDSFTGSLSRSLGEAAGNYIISLGTLSAGTNYSLNYTSALFTILAAPSGGNGSNGNTVTPLLIPQMLPNTVSWQIQNPWTNVSNIMVQNTTPQPSSPIVNVAGESEEPMVDKSLWNFLSLAPSASGNNDAAPEANAEDHMLTIDPALLKSLKLREARL